MAEFDRLAFLDDDKLELLMKELKTNLIIYKEIIAWSEHNEALINELVKIGIAENEAPNYSILISGIILRTQLNKIN
ncbi:hypothetical protein HB884_14790 [Listeria booriae]|uniref:hypothetical protein n=1 Tax=Listeria booriae TaxID=1552123 RepID=UPI00162AF65C|nr:hypothetical protein [Listeria booriae]MBC1525474.1 hypothetical protein [Listeria booriae]MBC6150072.1 hypothetical protein [Listeria booriae]